MGKMRAILVVATATASISGTANANMMSQFIDPKDGKFDASNWLIDNAVGFLPVPFLITEPAVGVGLGVSALFFHADEDFQKKVKEDVDAVATLPPSVSGLIGFGTSNGTWGTGGFHFGVWGEDSVRYLGALLYADVKLKYYDPYLGDSDGIDYSIKGAYLEQELKFRLGKSNVFVGGKYTYFDSTSEFDTSGVLPSEIPSLNFDLRDGAIQALIEYDSRDNVFTPESGIDLKYSYTWHKPALGGELDYNLQEAYAHGFQRLGDEWLLSGRLSGKVSGGDVPYYALPGLNMRGIPAMRYQGDKTILGEVEVRYDFTSRWSGIVFGGVGKAILDEDGFSNSDNRYTRGVGFRYLAARRYNFRGGLDVARGPDETAVYVTAGYAWGRD